MFFKYRSFLLLSLLLLFLGFLFGFNISGSIPRSLPTVKEKNLEPTLEILEKEFIGDSITFTYLFINNTKVIILLSFGGALTFGGLTFLNIIMNGMNLGTLFYDFLVFDEVKPFFLLVIPHGIFEIPGLIIAGAAGFKIPYELLRFALSKKEEIITEEDAKEFFKLVSISILLIFIAAVIESTVTLWIAENLVWREA